ncbi:nicotinamide mononucleotide transporter [Patescibacteria group bacterium]|nr:nicotinamide mononucleotide transporter [Patescibacteria group bacterium]
MKKLLYMLAAIISLLLVIATWQRWIPFDLMEVLGFVTGGWTVWLTVKENIWSWPIGIANSVFFLVLFLRSNLFADAGLQIVYIVLGALGWYWWLYGGAQKTQLKIERVGKKTVLVLSALTIVCTWLMTIRLTHMHDAAPFLDALTTVLSLVAQYLLTKKYLENWYVWMFVDVIYVALYGYKDLYLTAFLYFLFFCMCVRGFMEWKRTAQKSVAVADEQYVHI